MNPSMMLAQIGPDGPSAYGPLIMMAAIFGIFYVLVIYPQQKREREKENFRANLKKNDEVLAAGGLYGRVVEIKGPVVWLELGQNLRVKVERRSIEPPPAPAKPAKAAEQAS
jgi:preprotein translocase subunit YajC